MAKSRRSELNRGAGTAAGSSVEAMRKSNPDFAELMDQNSGVAPSAAELAAYTADKEKKKNEKEGKATTEAAAAPTVDRRPSAKGGRFIAGSEGKLVATDEAGNETTADSGVSYQDESGNWVKFTPEELADKRAADPEFARGISQMEGSLKAEQIRASGGSQGEYIAAGGASGRGKPQRVQLPTEDVHGLVKELHKRITRAAGSLTKSVLIRSRDEAAGLRSVQNRPGGEGLTDGQKTRLKALTAVPTDFVKAQEAIGRAGLHISHADALLGQDPEMHQFHLNKAVKELASARSSLDQPHMREFGVEHGAEPEELNHVVDQVRGLKEQPAKGSAPAELDLTDKRFFGHRNATQTYFGQSPVDDSGNPIPSRPINTGDKYPSYTPGLVVAHLKAANDAARARGEAPLVEFTGDTTVKVTHSLRKSLEGMFGTNGAMADGGQHPLLTHIDSLLNRSNATTRAGGASSRKGRIYTALPGEDSNVGVGRAVRPTVLGSGPNPETERGGATTMITDEQMRATDAKLKQAQDAHPDNPDEASRNQARVALGLRDDRSAKRFLETIRQNHRATKYRYETQPDVKAAPIADDEVRTSKTNLTNLKENLRPILEDANHPKHAEAQQFFENATKNHKRLINTYNYQQANAPAQGAARSQMRTITIGDPESPRGATYTREESNDRMPTTEGNQRPTAFTPRTRGGRGGSRAAFDGNV